MHFFSFAGTFHSVYSSFLLIVYRSFIKDDGNAAIWHRAFFSFAPSNCITLLSLLCTTLLSHCNIFDFDTPLLFCRLWTLSQIHINMDKSEKNTNNQKTNAKPDKDKKERPHTASSEETDLSEQPYYSVHPKGLEQNLQDLNAEPLKSQYHSHCRWVQVPKYRPR